MKMIQKNKWIINSILFILLALFIFVRLSYLFRPVSIDRRNLLGYNKEEAEVTDVVFIGGSSTYVFWEPYLAWKEYGIASYDYATDSMSPALLKGLMQEARNIKEPDLFVIDLRALEVRDSHPDFYSDAYLRNITDSLKYSKNRTDMIQYAYGYEQPELKNKIETYFDLIKYHVNWQDISQKQYEYRDGIVKDNLYKGFEIITTQCHVPLEEGNWKDVSEVKYFSDDVMQILEDILIYSKENDLNVLFTLNPFYQEKASAKKRYNGVKKLVEEYGYVFLNTNDYYDEMNIDFLCDFYNIDHVNLYGAEKYTLFLGDYITEHYAGTVQDRRNDYQYSIKWNPGLPAWEEAVAAQKKEIDEVIQNHLGTS